MDNEKEDTRKLLPIERFKHFKGIYLESTQQYFCCDFYEIVHPDSSITYRITADNKHTSLMTEMYQEGDIWKSKNHAIPEELEQGLQKEIESAFYTKHEATPEPQSELVEKGAFLTRLKTYLLRKLHS